jgi:hypothetical protein
LVKKMKQKFAKFGALGVDKLARFYVFELQTLKVMSKKPRFSATCWEGVGRIINERPAIARKGRGTRSGRMTACRATVFPPPALLPLAHIHQRAPRRARKRR